jgi:hypothetical protein
MILGPVAALSTGAPHVNFDRIDAQGVPGWIGRESIANISLVQDLLTRPDIDQEQVRFLRWLVVGGSTVPQALPRLYQERFGRRMTVGYGLTEGPNGVAKTHEDSPDETGCIGRPLPHLHLAVLNEGGVEVPRSTAGEIAIRAAAQGEWANVYTPALGYLNRPEASAKLLRGGWVHTGDVGIQDEAGEFHIRDRGSDLILRGGANVYPAEVERVLRMEPALRDCVVVGKAHARLGQSVAAFIEADCGSTQEEEALVARLHRQPRGLQVARRLDRPACHAAQRDGQDRQGRTGAAARRIRNGRGESMNASGLMNGKGYFMSPTVFAGVNPDMRIVKEKISVRCWSQGPLTIWRKSLPWRTPPNMAWAAASTPPPQGRASPRRPDRHRECLGQLLFHARRLHALWRLQGIGLGSGAERGRPRRLPRDQSGLDETRLTQG